MTRVESPRLFVGPACPRCVALKLKLMDEGMLDLLPLMDTSSPDALGEAMFYDILSTPALLVSKDELLEAGVRVITDTEEILQWYRARKHGLEELPAPAYAASTPSAPASTPSTSVSATAAPRSTTP